MKTAHLVILQKFKRYMRRNIQNPKRDGLEKKVNKVGLEIKLTPLQRFFWKKIRLFLKNHPN